MTLTSRALAVVSLVSITIATAGAFQTTRPASLLLDRAYMNDVRARGEKGDAAIAAAIARLEEDAKTALAIKPMSVMDKTITPPSGDKHDYMSQAPYWWPDPSKPTASRTSARTASAIPRSEDHRSRQPRTARRRGQDTRARLCLHGTRGVRDAGRETHAHVVSRSRNAHEP